MLKLLSQSPYFCLYLFGLHICHIIGVFSRPIKRMQVPQLHVMTFTGVMKTYFHANPLPVWSFKHVC